MLTPRQLAASEYNVVMAHGRSRPLGVDSADMVGMTQERVRAIRRAPTLVRGAEGIDRRSLRERDDARFAQMLESVAELGHTLEADGTRWRMR